MGIDKKMDVTGWTVEQRMRLPDWVFGNRQLIGVWGDNAAPGTTNWTISDIVLPDPCCLHIFSYLAFEKAGQFGNYRAALVPALPINVAEFDAGIEIYPYWGIPRAGPNLLIRKQEEMYYQEIPFRKGMVTNAWYLCVEVECVLIRAQIGVAVLVSGLPTDMAGWLAHNLV